MPSFDNMHRHLKTAVKQRPGSLPVIALNQTAPGEGGLATDLTSGHARLLHSLSDQAFAGGFHNAAGYGQIVVDVVSIGHYIRYPAIAARAS